MRRLTVFENISLDGYFVDAKGEMSWAHGNADAEWREYSAQNAGGSGGTLLFGRKTYELMASFWPTKQAEEQMPEVTQGMNLKQKLVVSRSLKELPWKNSTLLQGDLVTEIRKLKEGAGESIVVLGSGTIVAALTQAKLVDAYTFVVCPVVLGRGRTLFEGVTERLELVRTNQRAFGNGNVVVSYEPK